MKKSTLLGISIIGVSLICSGTYFERKEEIESDHSNLIDETKEFDGEGWAYPAYSYTNSPTNEPKYKNTTTFTNVGSYSQKTATYNRINVEEVWKSYRGESVKVAVIDTGCRTDHQEFDGTNISKDSYDIGNKTSTITDTSGHGTDTAACVAAAINGVGGTGIAPNVELYLIRAVNSTNTFPTEYLKSALNYCLENEVDVINMSIQGYPSAFSYEYVEDMNGQTYSGTISSSMVKTTLDDEINACYEKGITIVGAAGNYNTTTPAYPAANDHVIAVASTGLNSETAKAGFSNYGDWVDVCAPGYVIVPGSTGTSSYCLNLGTSFSAPIVTGAIALYKSKYPSAKPDQIEKALKASCNKLTWSGSGAGQIDVKAFLEYAPESEVESLTLPDETKTLSVGETYQLTPTILPADASQEVTYGNTDNSVVSISNTGLVTALKAGTSTVNVYSKNTSIYDTVVITVTAQTVANYTVTFDSNGGTGSMTSKTTSGSSYITPSCGFTAPSGKQFDRWALNSASGTKYVVGQSISGISSNITLYAIWKDNSSSNYYGLITDDMTGDTLKSKLHDIINNSSISVSYDWSRYEDADEDPNNSNNIITIYARTSLPKSSHISNNKGWNREHTFPQSKMESSQAEKDNHIIFASDYKVNGTRSNKKLMDLSSTSGTSPVLDSYGNATVCKTNSNYFDPGDTVARGYVARSTLYAAVMYGYDLLDNFDSIATVLSWNLNYYPTSNDERRNNIVYNNQKNRNPFVDHPEYACKIWGNTNSTTKQICGIGTEKTLSSITLSGNYKTTFNVGEDFTYSGLVVTANYSSGSPSTVTGFTVSSPDMTTAGTKTVTVSYTEGSVTKTATYHITVKSSGSTDAHTTGLTLDEITATVNVGSTINLVATKTPSDSVDPVTWSSSDSSVATVSNGTVTGVKAGTATITATSNGITATCTVTVNSSGSTEGSTTKTYTFSSSTDFNNITIGDVNLSIVSNGGSNPLWYTSDSAARIYHHGKYTFTSEKKIVSITFNFKNSTQTLALSANKGTYSNPTWTGSENEVIFTTSGSSGHNKVLSITVVYEDEQSGPKVTSVILDPKTLSFDLYQSTATKTITATVLGDSGVDTSVVWTSSRESVATVVNGIVTPTGVGQATITATSTADSTKSDTCIVTVSDSTPTQVETINVSNAPSTIEATKYKDVSITIGPNNATDKSVTWVSSSSAITISNSSNTGARLTASGEVGSKATITITANDGSGVSAFFEVTIVEKVVLTSIAWSGKTTYDVGSSLTNNDGHLIYAYYSDGTEKNITSNANVKITGFDSSEEQLNRVNVSYTEDGITKTTSQQLLILEGIGSGTSESYYEKVTSTADLTDGKYLIVYETGKVAFNGLLETFDVANNTVSIGNIANGKITATDTLDNAAFTYNSKDKSFLGAKGKYFGHSGSKNSLSTSSTAITNNVSFDTNGNVVINDSGNYSLKYNNNSGQYRFRFYTSGQQDIQIYKYVKGQTTTLTPEQNAKIYASSFSIGFTCDGSGIKAPTFANGITWSTLKSDYMKLGEDEKAFFVNATYNLNGSDVEETGDTNVVIAYAVARYDYVVAKYGYEDFMDRGIVSNRSNRIINFSNTEPTILITAITAMVGLAAIGGYFVFRRRREE